MKTRLFIALIVLVLAGGAAWWRVQSAAVEPGPATEDRRVTVPQGTSLRATLRLLAGEGLLAHPRLFELYLRCCHDGSTAVKAGDYLFTRGSTPLQILEQMVQGRVVLEQLTLVEGWTFTQFRTAIAAHPAIVQTLRDRKDTDVMTALGLQGVHPEGRFAPETYRFGAGTTDADLLRMAYEAQSRLLQQAWEQREPDLPLASPDEVLVLASIVEKETGLASERPLIAGVFVNRLRRGMRLQSDPTVIYGIRERYDGNIRRSDLVADTPWNTYTRAGLPPTPIAMPGKDALWATTHPATTEALYFVATGDGSGGHTFSATLEEHNRAVQRYLQRLRQGADRR